MVVHKRIGKVHHLACLHRNETRVVIAFWQEVAWFVSGAPGAHSQGPAGVFSAKKCRILEGKLAIERARHLVLI